MRAKLSTHHNGLFGGMDRKLCFFRTRCAINDSLASALVYNSHGMAATDGSLNKILLRIRRSTHTRIKNNLTSNQLQLQHDCQCRPGRFEYSTSRCSAGKEQSAMRSVQTSALKMQRRVSVQRMQVEDTQSSYMLRIDEALSASFGWKIWHVG